MISRLWYLLLMGSMASTTLALAAPAEVRPTTLRRTAPKPPRATWGPAGSARVVPPHAAASARTLDDIHIEGEIPVPQVLFITARDQRRFMEFQHRRYLKTGRQLAEASSLPDRIVVTPSRPTPEKETSR